MSLMLWFQEWAPNAVGHLCPEGAVLKDVLHIHPSVRQQRGSVGRAVQEKHGVCCGRQGVWGKAGLPFSFLHVLDATSIRIITQRQHSSLICGSAAIAAFKTQPLTWIMFVCVCLAQMSPRCASLALKHYLLKPVQRIPQYQLLLTGTNTPLSLLFQLRSSKGHKDGGLMSPGNRFIDSTWGGRRM